MATVKVGTLLIRTLAKPISSQIKRQAKEHERFRGMCVSLAQTMYRYEMKLRTNLLGEPAKHVRPLSEARAIENGANFLAEGFLFSVAVALIIGETWRTSRNTSKRRDNVDESLDSLQAHVGELNERIARWEVAQEEERQRNVELTRILERVVEIGLRGGWAEMQDTPLQIPRIQFNVDASRNPPAPLGSDSEPSLPSPDASTPPP
ncbi:OPA3-domain-containing protein [Auriscalpium vulgare]|uniref:OPA3-domain-containing protein n=1 Tax=Auriscalpium vulgare TaxID=40419 RepID=A0ACB8RJ99_9AGAM|nr:OPA3-domain-containing protein [Auriscalpium vulgare]